MDRKSLILGYIIYNYIYNKMSNLFINSYIKYLIMENRRSVIINELNNLSIGIDFNLLKIPEGDVLISCSDLDHDVVDNFVDNVSFCRSTYSIDKDDMKVYHIMSEVDVEYHGIDVGKIYKILKRHSESLKPYVAYMTINGIDVDPNEYLEFSSLEVIWD